MAGQESRFDFTNPQIARNEEMTILQKVLSFIEKKLEVRGYVKEMTFRNQTVFCSCGNDIYKNGDSELRNIYKKNLYGNATDIFCRICNKRLFFDTSQKAKQPTAPLPPPPEKPPLIIEKTNQNRVGNSMGSEKPQKNQDNKGKKSNEKSSFSSVTKFLLSILTIFALLLSFQIGGLINVSFLNTPAKAITQFFSSSPKGSGGIGSSKGEYTGVSKIPISKIEMSVNECLIEYAINKSDTSAVITSVINQAINYRKIKIWDLGESYIVDEMYNNRPPIDIRNEKTYKDLIKCVIMKLKAK
ncbi:MAG: hypothetical protein FWG84_04800 [Bacteroidales bacterium]|nr:hypothetical protein [Bacteroidales bacterium]